MTNTQGVATITDSAGERFEIPFTDGHFEAPPRAEPFVVRSVTLGPTMPGVYFSFALPITIWTPPPYPPPGGKRRMRARVRRLHV